MANEFLTHYLTLWNSSVEWVAQKIVDDLKSGNLDFQKAIELKEVAKDFSLKELEKDCEAFILENFWTKYCEYKKGGAADYSGLDEHASTLGI